MTMPGDYIRGVVDTLQPDGSIAKNVFYAQHASGPTLGTGGTFNDFAEWMQAIYDEWLPVMSDTYATQTLTLYLYNTVTGLFDPYVSNAFINPGGDVNQGVPNTVAAFSRSFSSNPRSTAAKYWNGLDESDSDGNNMSVAGVAAVAAANAVWNASFLAGGGILWAPQVWSKKDTVFYPLNGLGITDSLLSHQIRRKPGVGS